MKSVSGGGAGRYPPLTRDNPHKYFLSRKTYCEWIETICGD